MNNLEETNKTSAYNDALENVPIITDRHRSDFQDIYEDEIEFDFPNISTTEVKTE